MTTVAGVEKSYRMTSAGLVISRELSFTEWMACGQKLAAFASGLAFAIGDWLVYGQGRGEYGDTYERAQQLTGKSYETLHQYDRVSRTFPIEARDPRVAWSLYRLALVLNEGGRRRAIHLAAEKNWSQRDMLAHVQCRGEEPERASSKHERQVDGWRPPEQQEKRTGVACPQCGHRFTVRRKASMEREESISLSLRPSVRRRRVTSAQTEREHAVLAALQHGPLTLTALARAVHKTDRLTDRETTALWPVLQRMVSDGLLVADQRKQYALRRDVMPGVEREEASV